MVEKVMANFSFSIFGPEDGFKEFTVPVSGPMPDASFKINSADFEFKSGGKLIQVIKSKELAYVSLHQQVFQLGSDRPGYAFGEALFFERNYFDTNLITKNIFELHAAFSHACLTNNGRFDGSGFVGRYRSTQITQYEILKRDLFSKVAADDSVFSGVNCSENLNAYFVCDSLSNLTEVTKVVYWMVNSLGSMRYSRLIIIDDKSGVPSDSFFKISGIETESDIVLRAKFSELFDARKHNSVLQKSKAELELENSNLASKVRSLSAKVSEFELKLSDHSIANRSFPQGPKGGAPSGALNLANVERSVDALRTDFSKLKAAISQFQEHDLMEISENSAYAKFLSLSSLIFGTVSILLMVYGAISLYSLVETTKDFDEKLNLLVNEQKKNILGLEKVYQSPSVVPDEIGSDPGGSQNKHAPRKDTPYPKR